MKNIVIWGEVSVNDSSRKFCRNANVATRHFRYEIENDIFSGIESFKSSFEDRLKDVIRIVSIDWFKCELEDIYNMNISIITPSVVNNNDKIKCADTITEMVKDTCTVKVNWSVFS